MWVWVIIAVLFVFLMARTMQENASSTRSGFAALIGTIADGAGLVALTVGVFGLLLALVFGLLPGTGPRLAGDSLSATLAWSIGLLVAGMVLILLSVGIRRIGGSAAAAPALRGGH